MKKTVLSLMVGMLLIATNLYAEDGDLYVEGKLGVGIKSQNYKLHVHSPDKTRAGWSSVWTQVTTANTGTGPVDGFFWGIEQDSTGTSAQLWSETGMPILMCAGGNCDTASFLNGKVGIGTRTPQSRLSVVGLPTSKPDTSPTKGVLCITDNGNIWVETDGDCFN